MPPDLSLSLCVAVWAVHYWSTHQNSPALVTMDCLRVVLGVLVVVVAEPVVVYAVKYQAAVQPHKLLSTAVFIIFQVLMFL